MGKAPRATDALQGNCVLPGIKQTMQVHPVMQTRYGQNNLKNYTCMLKSHIRAKYSTCINYHTHTFMR